MATMDITMHSLTAIAFLKATRVSFSTMKVEGAILANRSAIWLIKKIKGPFGEIKNQKILN